MDRVKAEYDLGKTKVNRERDGKGHLRVELPWRLDVF